jgi:nitrate reductase gamma subunit
MSHFLDRLTFFTRAKAEFADGHGVMTTEDRSSQLLRRRQLMWGSNLFHVGILVIFVGHVVGLLTPIWCLTCWGCRTRSSRCSRS